MLLGTLGPRLLGNLLSGKQINRAGKGCRINRAAEGVLRASYGKKKKGFLIPPHRLSNFEIQKYYQNEPSLF